MKRRFINLFLMLLMLSVPIWACESPKGSSGDYVYRVTRVNPDGTVEVWMTGKNAHRENGFIVWKDKNGGSKSVAGAITVEPILIPKPEPENKKIGK